MGQWKLINKKEVYNHPYRRIEEWTLITPQGEERTYSIQVAAEVVVVFGITNESEVVLLHQYYIAHEKKVPTLVAGLMDEEDHRATAVRELREETGCIAREYVYLGSSFRGKYVTGAYHYYLALGVEKVGAQALESSEDIDVSFVSIPEFKQLLASGDLQDVAQVACAYRALEYLKL